MPQKLQPRGISCWRAWGIRGWLVPQSPDPVSRLLQLCSRLYCVAGKHQAGRERSSAWFGDHPVVLVGRQSGTRWVGAGQQGQQRAAPPSNPPWALGVVTARGSDGGGTALIVLAVYWGGAPVGGPLLVRGCGCVMTQGGDELMRCMRSEAKRSNGRTPARRTRSTSTSALPCWVDRSMRMMPPSPHNCIEQPGGGGKAASVSLP